MKRSRVVSFLILALAWISQTEAQQSGNGGPHHPVPLAPEAMLASYRSTLTEARMHAYGGDVDATEKSLVRLNHAKAGTAAWTMETAQRLVQIAEELGRDGNVSAISPFVTRALQHLKDADAQANMPQQHAQIEMFIGFVQERYLADRHGALVSYQSAAAFDPKSQHATENVDRLKRELNGPAGNGGTK